MDEETFGVRVYGVPVAVALRRLLSSALYSLVALE